VDDAPGEPAAVATELVRRFDERELRYLLSRRSASVTADGRRSIGPARSTAQRCGPASGVHRDAAARMTIRWLPPSRSSRRTPNTTRASAPSRPLSQTRAPRTASRSFGHLRLATAAGRRHRTQDRPDMARDRWRPAHARHRRGRSPASGRREGARALWHLARADPPAGDHARTTPLGRSEQDPAAGHTACSMRGRDSRSAAAHPGTSHPPRRHRGARSTATRRPRRLGTAPTPRAVLRAGSPRSTAHRHPRRPRRRAAFERLPMTRAPSPRGKAAGDRAWSSTQRLAHLRSNTGTRRTRFREGSRRRS
jgi:hypothetical protein